MSKKWIGVGITLAAGLATALFLQGCAADRTDVQATRENRVVIGVRSDISSFNIYTATNAFTQEIVDRLHRKLAWEGTDFSEGPPSFEPGLAKSWDLSPDGLSLTFHLDPDARWSDGLPVTADDVVFSHNAATSDDVGWVGQDVKEFIASVEAIDPRTVIFRFTRRYPYALMDAVEGNIVPSRQFGEVPFVQWPQTAFLDPPLSSGPFRVERYEPSTLIELHRNPEYSGERPPALDRVSFRILPDSGTLVNELLSGGIDVMEKLPPDLAQRVELAEGIRIVRVPDLSYTFICWNTSKPPLNDPRVRTALTLSIDRKSLIEGFVPRTGRPATSPIPSLLWAHHRGLEPLPYEPQRALELFGEAGFKDSDGDGVLDRDGVPFRLVLETNSESRLRGNLLDAITAQLRKVGLDVVPRRFEFRALIGRHEKHDFDAYVGSWRESTKVDLKSVFHTTAIDGAYNYGSFSNAELDTLIDEARQTLDPEQAMALWKDAQALIAREQPYTFLFEQDRLHAVREGLAGFTPTMRSAYEGIENWHWESLSP